jgi:hypothetical protein
MECLLRKKLKKDSMEERISQKAMKSPKISAD